MEIKRLKADLGYTKQKLNEMFGNEKTNTSYITLLDEKNLPNNSHIKFKIIENPRIETITAYVHNDCLELYGSARINIMPRASNSIYIYLKD